jgi:transposase
MARLFWLSDEAWAWIEPHLPHGRPGRPRVDARRVIRGILHVPKVGCHRQETPSAYGPAQHDRQLSQQVVPARCLAAAICQDRSRRPRAR